MAFIVHRGPNCFVLQITETGGFCGFMIAANPGESPRAFSYDFGPIYYTKDIVNRDDFPELAEIDFFAVDYSGFYGGDRETCLKTPPWQHLRNFFQAEGKETGYDGNKDKPLEATLPLLWQYTPPNPKGLWKVPAFAIWVNEQGCWLGNRDGLVVAFNHQGEIIHQHQLPRRVKSLIGDEDYLYASCDDGKIYELSGKMPQVVYNARPATGYYYDFQIFALALWEHHLLIMDVYGQMTLLNEDFQVQWQQKYPLWRGWMLRCDSERIYLGHSAGVNCYNRKQGKLLWEQPLEAAVLWGDLGGDKLIVGTSDGRIYSLTQEGDWKTQQTEMNQLCQCEGASYAGTVSADGQLILTGNHLGYLYSFTAAGELVWQHQTGCGAVLALQAWGGQRSCAFGDRLYGVTTNGTILAVNVHQEPQNSPFA
jgi:outer membrane protein assembly factor BamB